MQLEDGENGEGGGAPTILKQSKKVKVDIYLLDKIKSSMKSGDTVADMYKIDITADLISCLT